MTEATSPSGHFSQFQLLNAAPGAAPMPNAWNQFGEYDELGSINRLTVDRVAAAAGLVRSGEVFSLSAPINVICPEYHGHHLDLPPRTPLDPTSNQIPTEPYAGYPQDTTHWDGLRHARSLTAGWWGGRQRLDTSVGNDAPLGIERWVEHGIVGRGLLVDIERYFVTQGGPYDPFEPKAVSVADVTAAAQLQGSRIEPGDILCVRFGWLDAYRQLPSSDRREAASAHIYAGLSASEETAAWIWNAQLSAITGDNMGLEVHPYETRGQETLHIRLIPMLGVAIGELFDLGELSRACAADNRWDFLFVSAPLNQPGATAAPANAVAIR